MLTLKLFMSPNFFQKCAPPEAGQSDGYFGNWRRRKPRLAQAGYIFGLVTLIIFHAELFSGGFICRHLFGSGPVVSVLPPVRVQMKNCH